MTFESLVAYSAALAVAAFIPGPGVVAVVARSLGSGARHGTALLFGLVLGDLTYLAAACFGLAVLAEVFGEIFTLIRYGAGAYLAWLAWKLWRSSADMTKVRESVGTNLASSFGAGWLLTLANPKTIFFYLALLPTLLDLSTLTIDEFALLVPVTALVLLTVLTPYVILAARARHVLSRPAVLARLNRGAAAILAGTALWTVLRRA